MRALVRWMRGVLNAIRFATSKGPKVWIDLPDGRVTCSTVAQIETLVIESGSFEFDNQSTSLSGLDVEGGIVITERPL